MKTRHVFLIALVASGAALDFAEDAPVPVPKINGPIPVTPDSYPFLGAGHTLQPIDFAKAGYVEEEFLISGTANVYDWAADASLAIKTPNVPYTTRILVHRPAKASRFSGNVVVEPLMAARRYDWPIMWGYVHESLMEHGDAWVGVTVPANIAGLKKFNPARYSTLSFANPTPGATCPGGGRNGPSGIENGLRLDMLSQVGAALKSGGVMGELKVEGIFMTTQGGDLLTYMNAIHPHAKLANGKFVYDGYLSRNPGGLQRVNDCEPFPQVNDPRGGFEHKYGVPVIAVVAQGEVPASLSLRRDDSDDPADRFRLYEISGVSHIDKGAYTQFPTVADQIAAVGATQGTPEWPFNAMCDPPIPLTEQPALTYAYDAAFQHLFRWARKGVAPPKAARIEIQAKGASESAGESGAKASVALDEYGNGRGGVRTPYVDVPVATYFVTSPGPGTCRELGHTVPLEHSRLASLYPDAKTYTKKFDQDTERLVKSGWLTESDGRKIKSQARAVQPEQ
jgi:Alpha/beta hydrolase domain